MLRSLCSITSDSLVMAQSPVRTFYEFVRLETLDEWTHWLILIAVLATVASYVVFWYRRDWQELPRGLGIALLVLRLAAFIGILVYFLDLQKRSEQEIVRPSRVAVLVDTSLSMNLPSESAAESDADDTSRIVELTRSLENDPWLEQLTKKHETTLYRFDQSSRPVELAAFSRPETKKVDVGENANQQSIWETASKVAKVGSAVLALAGLILLLAIAVRVTGRQPSWLGYSVLGGVVLLITGLAFVSSAVLRASEFRWQSLWASAMPDNAIFGETPSTDSVESDIPNRSTTPGQTNWSELIAASGTESRIGDAIKSIIERERSNPLAGLILITDGQNNAGGSPREAISVAQLNNVPIFTIGLGSTASPKNVRIVDVEAPKRVFPGDAFQLTALIQANGLLGQSVTIQLRRSKPDDETAVFDIEEELPVELGEDDNLQPINFEIQPPSIGEWTYEVKIISATEDSNDNDNAMSAQVRVIEPRSKVLLVAGGPTREYQFVRNMLYRDETVQSYVYLQTGGPGISQESQELLLEFPETLEELLEFDTILSFDTDWMSIPTPQVELVEQWVSSQAGGLILIAGPVATPRWAGTEGNGDSRAQLLRQMSPTVLNSRGARLISLGRFESETAFPLSITEDGWRSEFVSVVPGADRAKALARSKQVWNEFGGVYTCYSCYEAKPAASVLAYFSDPAMSVDGQLPIYLATQFFGSGRVAFQGGGEIWRLREQSIDYFDQYYVKLVRWAGQGRLLRDSDRGQLLLDREQAFVGEQISVRAVLKDDQFEPLLASQVECLVVGPDQRRTPIRLLPLQDASQPGVFVGQFLASQTGTFTVELPIGGLGEQEILTQQVSVRIPAREIQRPQRNDSLLAEIAAKTGGLFYPGLESAIAIVDNECAISTAIESADQNSFLPGAPDREFQQRLMTMLMIFIIGCLSTEWLLRRINKLA